MSRVYDENGRTNDEYTKLTIDTATASVDVYEHTGGYVNLCTYTSEQQITLFLNPRQARMLAYHLLSEAESADNAREASH